MMYLRKLFWYFRRELDLELALRRKLAFADLESGVCDIEEAKVEYHALLELSRDELAQTLVAEKVLYLDAGAAKDLLVCHLDVMIRDFLFESEQYSSDEREALLQDFVQHLRDLVLEERRQISTDEALGHLRMKRQWFNLKCYHLFQLPLGEYGVSWDPVYWLNCADILDFK